MVKRENLLKILNRLIDVGIVGFISASVVSIAATQIFYALAFAAWTFKLLLAPKSKLRFAPLDFAFGIFFLSALLSTVFSAEPLKSFIGLKKFLLIPIPYLIANNIKSEERMRELIYLIFFMTALVSLYGLTLYFGGLQDRLRATQSIYMTMGGLLVIVASFVLSLFLFNNRLKEKLLLGITLFLLLTSLIFTYTRSSWVGFLSAALLIGVLKTPRFLFFLAFLLLLSIFFLPQGVIERGKSTFSGRDWTVADRVAMWKAGAKMVRDHPLVGVGLIDLKAIYQKYMLPEAYQVVGHLHNNFVQIGVTMGFLGLTSFLWLLYNIAHTEFQIYRKIKEEEKFLKAITLGSLASFFGFLMNGFFEWNFGDAEVIMLIWFTLGLSLATEKLEEEKKV